jgi:DNA-directed RNA polymerase subunit beta
MTPSGTFVINGAERVVCFSATQISGVFFGQSFHKWNKIARVIPFKGSWIEFSTDINSVMYAYIDRRKSYLLLLYSVQLDSKEIRISLRF